MALPCSVFVYLFVQADTLLLLCTLRHYAVIHILLSSTDIDSCEKRASFPHEQKNPTCLFSRLSVEDLLAQSKSDADAGVGERSDPCAHLPVQGVRRQSGGERPVQRRDQQVWGPAPQFLPKVPHTSILLEPVFHLFIKAQWKIDFSLCHQNTPC